MPENSDEKFGKIHDTVHGMQLDFVSMKKDQEATNKSVQDICGKLDRYADGSEKRLTALESNLGSRIPDDPTAFSQLQSHAGFIKRSQARLTMLGGVVVTILLALVSQLFGLIGKGR